jgi:hypothetical protein
MNPNIQVCQSTRGIRVADHENLAVSTSVSRCRRRLPHSFSSSLKYFDVAILRGKKMKHSAARKMVKEPSMINKYCQFQSDFFHRKTLWPVRKQKSFHESQQTHTCMQLVRRTHLRQTPSYRISIFFLQLTLLEITPFKVNHTDLLSCLV